MKTNNFSFEISIAILTVMSLLLVGCQAKTENTNDNNKENIQIDINNSNITPEPMQNEEAKSGDTVATIDTDLGMIKIKLFPSEAPEITKNFIELANSGKYNNVPFHRVIDGFMIQTGDFTKQDGTGGYSYKGPDTELKDEISSNLSHIKGAVSMANRGPNTNGSQFFIVTGNQGATFLDGGYSIFGQVLEGQDIADKISKVKTDSHDKPLEQVLMKSVKIEKI